MESKKIINRNLKFDSPNERQETSSYKCQYGDRNKFQILQINISYGNDLRIYEIDSTYLKPTSQSIHFNAVKKEDSFEIFWKPKEIIPYIKRIK